MGPTKPWTGYWTFSCVHQVFIGHVLCARHFAETTRKNIDEFILA